MSDTVTDLFRYPVKSMMGERLDEAQLTATGIVGDRVFAVRDEVRGGIRGGKKIPSLMTMSATTEAAVRPCARITGPNGESRFTSDTDVNAWLSSVLEHEVTLWPLLPPEQLDHYRRGAPDHEDFEQELRAIFGRLEDEPLPDLEMFAEVMDFESPPGTYFDAFPIHILSHQSLATLGDANPGQRFDQRRFRPNLLVDLPDIDAPFPEQTLTGRTLAIGTTHLHIVGPCPRCSMTTHGFADLPRDTGIMRTLVHQAEGSLGIYAQVTKPGDISAGAAITVID